MSRSIRPRGTRLTRAPVTQSVPAVPPASATPSSSTAVELHQESALESLLRELRIEDKHQGSLLGSTLITSLEALWANRTRSLLTMLGIVIGIAAVIGSLTMTQGVGAYIDGVLQGFGSTTISIAPGAKSSGGVVSKQAFQSLTQRDLQSLRAIQHVTAVSPFVLPGQVQIVFGNQSWKTRVQGVSTDLQTIQNWQIADGLWFTKEQDTGGAAVAVLGDTVARNIFGASGVEPVGQQIRVRDQLFRVVGVLAPKGGFNQDDTVFVPYKAAQARLSGQDHFDQVQLSADSKDTIDQVVQNVKLTLEENHHIPKGVPDDFQIETLQQVLDQENQQMAAISTLFAGIAAISLTIGGVGIMNIMLVSVTERTREIGIRISIGARRADIRNQFLIESLVLCLLGGLLGMLLGTLIGWFMSTVLIGAFARGSGGSGAPFVITPGNLIMPFVVSAAIGVVFGLYPAIRASRLDPIIALRRPR
ncbi:FtsX-like permease family protein [Ktedonosporobacter rubrisoli]|uniref:FtsX-like permease family protein n=1 Tax=Ktedonosporobacter rubrisoli TaxID=2509675 RepID=A0A4P6K228_KTERU|nr:ABC transporter permease [Ktedonosporobacter rubrisoli]QBD81893.1 FtsX-like permease family protein [Ktedonosporobacter rubrisoli]